MKSDGGAIREYDLVHDYKPLDSKNQYNSEEVQVKTFRLMEDCV